VVTLQLWWCGKYISCELFFGMVVRLLTFRVLDVFEVLGVRVFEFWVLGFEFWFWFLVWFSLNWSFDPSCRYGPPY
jgi:hypothetical protein